MQSYQLHSNFSSYSKSSFKIMKIWNFHCFLDVLVPSCILHLQLLFVCRYVKCTYAIILPWFWCRLFLKSCFHCPTHLWNNIGMLFFCLFLFLQCKYKEIFEKTKSQFQYVADSPINKHFKHATQLMDGVSDFCRVLYWSSKCVYVNTQLKVHLPYEIVNKSKYIQA